MFHALDSLQIHFPGSFSCDFFYVLALMLSIRLSFPEEFYAPLQFSTSHPSALLVYDRKYINLFSIKWRSTIVR